MHDERVEVVAQAPGGRGVAGLVELADQRLESLRAVALVDGLVECLPVGVAERVSDELCVRPGRLWSCQSGSRSP
jgi:hypothetical protein